MKPVSVTSAWPPRAPRLRRAAVWIAVTLLLHAWLLAWLDRATRVGARHSPTSVEAMIVPSPLPAQPAVTPPPKPAPAARAHRPRPQHVEPTITVPAPPPEHTPPEHTPPEPTPTDSPPESPPTTDASGDAPAQPTPSASDATRDAGARPGDWSVADLPPPAIAHYDAQGDESGRTYYGSGTLQLALGADGYRIEQSASIDLLFLSLRVLNSTSVGTITAAGFTPTRYVEQVRNRPAVATNFNRDAERRSITFSSSTDAVALVDGAQDRVSVIFQLMAWMRSNPGRIHAGDTFDFALAGLRSVDAWKVEVVGEETVETAAGTVAATHLRRIPPADSYERRFDVWLAPSRAWYPVKIVYTERKGNQITLTFKSLERPDGSAATAAP